MDTLTASQCYQVDSSSSADESQDGDSRSSCSEDTVLLSSVSDPEEHLSDEELEFAISGDSSFFDGESYPREDRKRLRETVRNGGEAEVREQLRGELEITREVFAKEEAKETALMEEVEVDDDGDGENEDETLYKGFIRDHMECIYTVCGPCCNYREIYSSIAESCSFSSSGPGPSVVLATQSKRISSRFAALEPHLLQWVLSFLTTPTCVYLSHALRMSCVCREWRKVVFCTSDCFPGGIHVLLNDVYRSRLSGLESAAERLEEYAVRIQRRAILLAGLTDMYGQLHGTIPVADSSAHGLMTPQAVREMTQTVVTTKLGESPCCAVHGVLVRDGWSSLLAESHADECMSLLEIRSIDIEKSIDGVREAVGDMLKAFPVLAETCADLEAEARLRVESHEDNASYFAIDRKVFKSLAKEICQDYRLDLHFEECALEALQYTAEDAVVHFFKKCKRVAEQSNRDTIEIEDVRFVSDYDKI